MDTFFCHNVGVRIREVPPTCMCLQMSVETIALPLVVSIVNGGLALVVGLHHSHFPCYSTLPIPLLSNVPTPSSASISSFSHSLILYVSPASPSPFLPPSTHQRMVLLIIISWGLTHIFTLVTGFLHTNPEKREKRDVRKLRWSRRSDEGRWEERGLMGEG